MSEHVIVQVHSATEQGRYEQGLQEGSNRAAYIGDVFLDAGAGLLVHDR